MSYENCKEPLYRKVNTRTRGVVHRHGGDYRHERHTKAERNSVLDGVVRGPMHGKTQRGLDYTPLFRFLLSKVGGTWVEVHAEAVSRLDREEPLYWMVARTPLDEQPFVRIGANAFYSGLKIDAEGRLVKVAPDLKNDDLTPNCACCTHTFNGVPLVQKYVPPGEA